MHHKYKIIRSLGSGAFSDVVLAEEEMTGRKVAIKGIKKKDYPPSRMKFLLTEFQTMSKISGHRNIVSIYTVEPGEDDHIAWIVMEYVDGPTLHMLMKEGPLTLTDTLHIGLDICRGLQNMHAHKIMHRDIKPENVLLTADKEAKIIDFGIARIFSDNTNTEFAQTICGTRRYMAPEQHYGPYDYRADLYPTGLILFQAATGQFPFSGEHKEIQKKKVSGEVEEIEKSPEVLRPFFNKALHQELSERHKSADEMYDELNCILQDEYIKQVSPLIDAGVSSRNPKLAETLLKYQETFRLPPEVANWINRYLFFERQQKGNGKRDTIPPLAANPANPAIEEIAVPIQQSPDKDPVVLSSTLLEGQELTSTSEETESDAYQVLTEISPEFLLLLTSKMSSAFVLDRVHTDIQHPHEEEALQILQNHTCYKQLAKFYEKKARVFAKGRRDFELIANCYTRARFAYAVGGKHRLAKRNARKAGTYYTRLAQKLQLNRAWDESGKAYLLAACNYEYANLPDLVDECCRIAIAYYFNFAESARLNNDPQTTFIYSQAIVLISDAFALSTLEEVSEARKLLAQIQEQV